MTKIDILVEHLSEEIIFKMKSFPKFPIELHFINEKELKVKVNTIESKLSGEKLITFHPGFQHIKTKLYIYINNLYYVEKFWYDNPIILN